MPGRSFHFPQDGSPHLDCASPSEACAAAFVVNLLRAASVGRQTECSGRRPTWKGLADTRVSNVGLPGAIDLLSLCTGTAGPPICSGIVLGARPRFMAHARARPPAEDHSRRNARRWLSRSLDLLLRLQVQPLDDNQWRQMAG